jgi:hypothetical protein
MKELEKRSEVQAANEEKRQRSSRRERMTKRRVMKKVVREPQNGPVIFSLPEILFT